MLRESLNDGRAIGRAIEDVAVGVVSLQHIKKHIAECRALLAVGNIGLQSAERIGP